MCIFKVVKMQSGIGFIVDALFGNVAYLHNLYSVLELHTYYVFTQFERQPHSRKAIIFFIPLQSLDLPHADQYF